MFIFYGTILLLISIKSSLPYLFEDIGCDRANLFQGSCVQVGNFSLPRNCQVFISCSSEEPGAQGQRMTCSEGTIFLEKACMQSTDLNLCPQMNCESFFKIRQRVETTKRAQILDKPKNRKQLVTHIKSADIIRSTLKNKKIAEGQQQVTTASTMRSGGGNMSSSTQITILPAKSHKLIILISLFIFYKLHFII